MDWKDVLERAALTFAQATLAVIVVAGTNLYSVKVWETALVAGLAAVASFGFNTVRKLNADRKGSE